MTGKPEFSRPVRLDTLGEQPRAFALETTQEERAALAARFGLIAIEALTANAECARDGAAVNVSGRLTAQVVQSCVASGDPVPARIDEDFQIRFLPEEQVEAGEDEIELSEQDCDIIGYQGGAVDLGEAVAETLMLALDPFPRSRDADAVLKAAGVVSEADAVVGPFSALKALRDKLGGGD